MWTFLNIINWQFSLIYSSGMLVEVVTYIIIAVFIGISQSAGIGGGPVLNISLMVGLGYNVKECTYITYIFLMGGAFASIIINLKKTNPQTGGRVMDYDLILITLPMTATGAIIGAIINHYISQLVITIMFTILLTYLTISSYKKYNETNFVNQQKNIPLLDKINDKYQQKKLDPRLIEILEQQNKIYPKDKLYTITQLFIYTLIILLCKGGRHYNSSIGLTSCGIGSYLCILIHFILSIIYSKNIAHKKIQLDNQKEKLGYVFKNKNDKLDQKTINSTMLVGLGAGMIGATLGIGGSIILVPVWINNGINKITAATSSAPIIFFSGIIAFTLSLLGGNYHSFTSVLFHFFLAFVSAYAIRQIITYLTNKYHLKSVVIGLLLITMSSCLVVSIPFSLLKLIQDPQGFLLFGRLC